MLTLAGFSLIQTLQQYFPSLLTGGLIIGVGAAIGIYLSRGSRRPKPDLRIDSEDSTSSRLLASVTGEQRGRAEEEAVLAITRSDMKYLVEYRPIGRTVAPVATKQLIDFDPLKRDRILRRLDDLTATANTIAQIARGTFQESRSSGATSASTMSELKSLGGVIFDYFLSANVADMIMKGNGHHLVIETNDTEIPWELMYDGSDFLATKHYSGRTLVVETEGPQVPSQPSRTELRTALIIDPTESLPAARSEAELARVLKAFGTVDVYQGKKIDSLEGMRILGRGGYDIIHYAGHAEFNTEQPTRSSLSFADGTLTAGEMRRVIEKSRSRPRLVFVNACTSATESSDTEIEYLGSKIGGLGSVFLKAGVLGYIGAVWSIFDQSAQFLASEFYSRALAGDTVGKALTQARVSTRLKYPNDLSWASFVLYGHPSVKILNGN